GLRRPRDEFIALVLVNHRLHVLWLYLHALRVKPITGDLLLQLAAVNALAKLGINGLDLAFFNGNLAIGGIERKLIAQAVEHGFQGSWFNIGIDINLLASAEKRRQAGKGVHRSSRNR